MKTAIGYPSPWKLLALAALPALVVGLALMLALVVTSGTAADELAKAEAKLAAETVRRPCVFSMASRIASLTQDTQAHANAAMAEVAFLSAAEPSCLGATVVAGTSGFVSSSRGQADTGFQFSVVSSSCIGSIDKVRLYNAQTTATHTITCSAEAVPPGTVAGAVAARCVVPAIPLGVFDVTPLHTVSPIASGCQLQYHAATTRRGGAHVERLPWLAVRQFFAHCMSLNWLHTGDWPSRFARRELWRVLLHDGFSGHLYQWWAQFQVTTPLLLLGILLQRSML
jgi:hypothetical protein